MPKIRTIKPNIVTHGKFLSCSREARFLFMQLITQADDYGRYKAEPWFLKGHLYGRDDDVTSEMVSGWLEELQEARLVHRYSVSDDQFLCLHDWDDHQNVYRRGRPTWPEPPDGVLDDSWPSEAFAPARNSRVNDAQVARTASRDSRANDASIASGSRIEPYSEQPSDQDAPHLREGLAEVARQMRESVAPFPYSDSKSDLEPVLNGQDTDTPSLAIDDERQIAREKRASDAQLARLEVEVEVEVEPSASPGGLGFRKTPSSQVDKTFYGQSEGKKGVAKFGEEEEDDPDDELPARALQLLARRDLAAARASGAVIGNRPAWLAAVEKRRAAEDLPALKKLHLANPELTAEQLANAIDPEMSGSRVPEYIPTGPGQFVKPPDWDSFRTQCGMPRRHSKANDDEEATE